MWLVGCNADNLVIGDGGANNKCSITDDTVFSTIQNFGGTQLDYEQ